VLARPHRRLERAVTSFAHQLMLEC
jgi:hypothetical protein